MRDKIVNQKWSQTTAGDWTYTIRTMNGKVYTAHYTLLNFGFCQEKFMEGTFLIWDREFKIGEPLRQTIYEVIEREESLAV